MDQSPDPPRSFTRPRDNVAALLGVQVLRFSAGIAVAVLVARALGPEGFGAYTFVATVAHLAGFAATLGLHQLLPREIARAPERADALVGGALRATALGSLLAAAPIAVYVGLREPGLLLAAALAAAGLGLQSLVNVYMAGFEGLRRVALQLRGVAAGRIAFVAATAAALAAGGPVAALFGAQALAFAVTLALFARTWRRAAPAAAPAPAGPLMAAGAPFAAWVGLAAVQERVDVLILEAWHGDAAVGAYRGATLLLLHLPVAAHVLATAAYPRLARAAMAADASALEALLARLLRLLLAGGAALAVGGALCGADLLTWALGPEWAASGRLFAWAAWLVPVLFARIGVAIALSATDGERPRAAAMALAAAANLALNLALVPRWGAVGALAASFATEALLLLALAAPRARLLARALRPADALRALAPSLAMGAALLPLADADVALRVAVGAATWGVVGPLVGAWRRDDLVDLRRW